MLYVVNGRGAYSQYQANAQVSCPALDGVKFLGALVILTRSHQKPWLADTIAWAEDLCKHKFKYLALGEIDLGERVNWNHEYKHDIDTPLLFAPWMDYRDNQRYGDFKYFWGGATASAFGAFSKSLPFNRRAKVCSRSRAAV